MTVQFLHTKLQVRDLERAIAFYQVAFGYELRKRKPGPHDSSLAFLALPGDEVELQLAEYPGVEAVEVPARLMHLAFRVSNLEGSLGRVQEAGGTIRTGPYALPSGSRVAFVGDRDGYELELIQKPD
jgi:lactoylglutathione lyase